MRMGDATRIVADQDVPKVTLPAGDSARTASGAGGAAIGALAGAAGRINLFPRNDITINAPGERHHAGHVRAGQNRSLSRRRHRSNVGANRIVSDLDVPTLGLEEATVGQTLRRGVTNWRMTGSGGRHKTRERAFIGGDAGHL